MNERSCTYSGDRAEALIAYLYDDGQTAGRAAFDAHVAGCAACRTELAELTAIRSELMRWVPPEPKRPFTYAASPTARRHGVWAALGEIPAWAQVAAALLFVGIAAGVANLEVRYDRDGLLVRTGWSASAPADADPSARQARPAPGLAAVSTLDGTTAPWRSDLTALEQQLRTEFRGATAVARSAAPAPGNEEILRRVRAVVEQSERRQQRELALRVGELLRDVQAQRAADLVRIDRTLGYIQNDTGTEVMRQRRMLNDLAVRVTQRQ
jgi:anti-sigma factor RsiW